MVQTQFYFDMEIRVSARRLLGNEDYPTKKEARELVLTSDDNNSLVVDRLCDQAIGQNTPITCFCFEFAARKEQTATNMFGSFVETNG